MTDPTSCLRVLWLFAAGALSTLSALLRGELGRRNQLRRQHMQRLAAEIVEVAQSIQADLAILPRTSAAAELARRCAECRVRSEQAAAPHNLSQEALRRALGQLHDDHLRIVDLRSDVDAALAAQRSGKEITRACHFATGSKPSRTRWSCTGTFPRPSSFC